MTTVTESRPPVAEATASRGRVWFLTGLFFSTLATLGLEMLDTRLLSVMTWYHLSFFAVSTAMLGMSAAAVHVFLAGNRFHGQDARAALARFGWLFALSIPLSHIGALCVQLKFDLSLTGLAIFSLVTLLLGAPFYLAGFLVTIALTRTEGRIGLTYAVDLLGASLGSLLVIALLSWLNISSAFFAVGFFAVVGAYCFQKYAGVGSRGKIVWLGVILLVATVLNSMTIYGFRVFLSKTGVEPAHHVAYEGWNTHSQVIMDKPAVYPPFYWGAEPRKDLPKFEMYKLVIDGLAATPVTKWDGDPASLEWVKYDVTSLPYHLRKDTEVAIIGAGGGRDLLSALWGRCKSVTGIELNSLIYNLIEGRLRKFANLADRKDVRYVNDEARSYLTHHKGEYDVVQMSLVDTWASTGAGAFTLSENGLYTREGWKVFLDALKPGGVFSVSRWYAKDSIAETSRTLALGTAALLDRGVTNPGDYLALVACKDVATLLTSTAPLTDEDLRRLDEAAKTYKFEILVAPKHPAADPMLAAIAGSHSHEDLASHLTDKYADYSPSTDDRPYFFNFAKASVLPQMADPVARAEIMQRAKASQLAAFKGNLIALATLSLLGFVSAVLVVTIIIGPLLRAGLPEMTRSSFIQAVAYFAIIGMGFMMVQIPFMQRFSVYLGHPTYAIAVILFSMIFFTGLGSFFSDHVPIETRRGWLYGIPLGIAGSIMVITLIIQPVINATVHLDLLSRCLIVVGLTGPIALLLGFCFPIGMRLVGRLSDDATAWMWGVNGACGVLASVIAVVLSIFVGIHASLFLAAALYAALAVPALLLWRQGFRAA